jgi:RNA polymerase sigma-70 factor (ECF subfamily)
VTAQATSQSSDSDLIAESLSRPEAFAAIFDRHFDAVHHYLSRRAGAGVADDLASQTFIVAFSSRAGFRPSATSARPWLFGIATNVLRNNRRAELRLLRALSRVAAGAPDRHPDLAGADAGEQAGALSAALARMDTDQRDVLLLHVWADLSYEEIAASLGIPVGTVRSRLSRGRARLRSALASARADGAARPSEGSLR